MLPGESAPPTAHAAKQDRFYDADMAGELTVASREATRQVETNAKKPRGCMCFLVADTHGQ